MSLELVQNLSWLDSNAARAYPLTVEATGRDVTGTFTLPDDFLVELYINVNFGLAVDPSQFYISAIGAYANGYSVVIGYAGQNVASALVAAAGFQRNTPYRLGGMGNFLDTTGHLVIGSLENIGLQPQGQWAFDETGGRLESDCIRPIIQGVSSLIIQNGGDVSQPLVGDVILRAGANMRITPVLIAGQPPEIVFDAIQGEGLNSSCQCDGSTTAAQPINFIDGVGPTADGHFTLLGDDCLQWSQILNGLQAIDECSAPCCGPTELVTITQALQLLSQQIATAEAFLPRLEALATELENRVNGSALGGSGCVECG